MNQLLAWLAAAFGMLLAAGGAGAAPPAALLQTDYDLRDALAAPDCAGVAPSATNACMQAAVIEWQARMHSALDHALESVDRIAQVSSGTAREAKATIEATQTAWQAYVDQRCNVEVPMSMAGGTQLAESEVTCLVTHLRRRAAELDDIGN